MSDVVDNENNEEVEEEQETEVPEQDEQEPEPSSEGTEEEDWRKYAYQEEREKRKKATERVERLERELEEIRAKSSQEPPKEQPSEFDAIEDDEYASGAHVKKLYNEFKNMQQQLAQQAQYQAQLAASELRFVDSHPDYKELISKYVPKMNRELASRLGSDPATAPEAFYRVARGMQWEEMNKQDKMEQADAMRKGEVGPRSQGVPGGKSKSSRDVDVDSMSAEEFDDHMKSLSPQERKKFLGEA